MRPMRLRSPEQTKGGSNAFRASNGSTRAIERARPCRSRPLLSTTSADRAEPQKPFLAILLMPARTNRPSRLHLVAPRCGKGFGFSVKPLLELNLARSIWTNHKVVPTAAAFFYGVRPSRERDSRSASTWARIARLHTGVGSCRYLHVHSSATPRFT